MCRSCQARLTLHRPRDLNARRVLTFVFPKQDKFLFYGVSTDVGIYLRYGRFNLIEEVRLHAHSSGEMVFSTISLPEGFPVHFPLFALISAYLGAALYDQGTPAEDEDAAGDRLVMQATPQIVTPRNNWTTSDGLFRHGFRVVSIPANGQGTHAGE
jgi:hypothetical protein